MSAMELWRMAEGPMLVAGAWLATYFVHATLLLAGAWLVARRVRSSTLRERLWALALLGGIATASAQAALRSSAWPFEWPAAIPTRAPSAVPSTPHAPSTASLDRAPSAPPATRPTSPDGARSPIALEEASAGSARAPRLAWPALFAAIWLAGALLALARLARAELRARRALADRAPSRDGRLVEALDRLRARSGMRRPVALSLSDRIASPCALSSRELCLPRRAERELASDELQAVLAHELAHVARRDPLRARFVALVEALFWMQPLNRVAARALREEAELRCDAWAAARTAEPLALARSLERVASWVGDARALPLAPAMWRRESALVRRVERLLDEPASPTSRPQRALHAFGSLFALALVAGFAPAVQLAGRGEAPREADAGGPGADFEASLRALGYVQEAPKSPRDREREELEAKMRAFLLEQQRARDAAHPIYARIEIAADGTMSRDGRVLFDPKSDEDFTRVREELARIAHSMRKEPFDLAHPDRPLLPDEWLALRCEPSTRMHWLLKAMEQCGRSEVLIWRLTLELPSAEGDLLRFDVPLPRDLDEEVAEEDPERPTEPFVTRERFEVRVELAGSEAGGETGARSVQYVIAARFLGLSTPSLFGGPDWKLILRTGDARARSASGLSAERISTAEDVPEILAELHRLDPKRGLVVDARRGTLWSDVAPVVAAAQAAGIAPVTFVGSYE